MYTCKHVCTANPLMYDNSPYITRSDRLSATELTTKLEPAFLCGVRCSHIPTRKQFCEVFRDSVQKNLLHRLLYIVCTQNWEHCGSFFWVKHCIEVSVVMVLGCGLFINHGCFFMCNICLLLPNIIYAVPH